MFFTFLLVQRPSRSKHGGPGRGLSLLFGVDKHGGDKPPVTLEGFVHREACITNILNVCKGLGHSVLVEVG